MKKSLFLFSILALTFNSCSSQTEKDPKVEEEVVAITSQVIKQSTWESKIAEVMEPQVIDVRTPQEFSEGHLPDALNIDFYSSDFKTQVAHLDKERPVFVYCRSGGRSAKACNIMEQEGFQAIYDLEGGYLGWK